MQTSGRIKKSALDIFSMAVTFGICLVAAIDLVRYAVLGSGAAFLTMLVVEAAFVCVALAAWRGRCHALLALVAAAGKGGGSASYPRAGAGYRLRRRVGGMHGGGR